MTVYIEYAILDNLIIDAIIIYLVALSMHTTFRRLNVILTLTQGITYAIITPFITASVFFVAVIKIAYSVLMVLSLCKHANFKHFLITYLLFISYTFVLGGACFALLNIFSIPYNQNGLLLNGYALPISIIVLVVFVYVVLLIKLIRWYMRERKTVATTYDVVITVCGKKYYLRGFLDSGNTLYDKDNPIIVISFSTFCKMFSKFPYGKLAMGKVDSNDLNCAHYVNVNTVGESVNMLVFEADSIIISQNNSSIVVKDVHLGVSHKNFNNFECLLHQALL